MNKAAAPLSYWKNLWLRFKKHTLGYAALLLLFVFVIAAIYAPFLASSKPLFVVYDGVVFFPLFRYLFYPEFFTKNLDIFFNVMIFTFPIFFLCSFFRRLSLKAFFAIALLQIAIFLYLLYYPISNPASNQTLNQQLIEAKKIDPILSWNEEVAYMSSYAKLNAIIEYQLQKKNDQTIKRELSKTLSEESPLLQNPPTLWDVSERRTEKQLERLYKSLEALHAKGLQHSKEAIEAKKSIAFIKDRQQWLQEQQSFLQFEILPFLSNFHWEDDAGGSQLLNQHLRWWQMTRINHKSLLAGLLFGIRISLVVGILAVAIALSIAIPVGSLAGYFGGTFDIIVSRLLEIWESMPTFFMLLLVVAITQSKSIFLIIAVIGFFGWTGFSRFLRGEFFKQRNLPYVEACKSLGYTTPYTIFIHILPNAIPPLLTLLPFSIMGAISGEAGLSFLGLGEEGSCSWGVLMDEGRSSFPAQSELLWPPAFLLTALLVLIALVGDALRDTLDPKLQS